MPDKEIIEIFEKIRDTHIHIEKIFQSMADKLSIVKCVACTETCCNVKICIESVDSCFLSFIRGNLKTEFDDRNGWHNNKMGCTIPYGRPFICYEYFCSKFENENSVNKLKYYSHLFKTIYNRIYKRQHVVLLQNLEGIKKDKLFKVLHDLQNLEQELLQNSK